MAIWECPVDIVAMPSTRKWGSFDTASLKMDLVVILNDYPVVIIQNGYGCNSELIWL